MPSTTNPRPRRSGYQYQLCEVCHQPVWISKATRLKYSAAPNPNDPHRLLAPMQYHSCAGAPPKRANKTFIDDEQMMAHALSTVHTSLKPGDKARWQQDPCAWAEERMDIFLWSKQREIARSVVSNRYTAVQSCHGVGKSHLAGNLAAWWIDVHIPGEAFVVTTAPTAPQVVAILWREINRAHKKGKLPGRTTGGNVPMWKIGNEIVGFGRKPADYDANAFQGIHARYVLVIIDEANGIPKVLWDAVDALVTNEKSRVLAIGNPDDPSSQFREVCKPGSGWKNIRIDALLSPNFTGEKIPPSLSELLVSKEWVRERMLRWGKGSPLWQSKVRGRFPDISADTLIMPAWIEAAQNRWHEMTGDTYKVLGQMGADIARYGDDETTIYRQRNGRVEPIEFVRKQATTEVAGRITTAVLQYEQKVPVVVDEIGVGAGVLDMLLENGLPAYGFNGSNSPVGNLTPGYDAEKFLNYRAECWWYLRYMFQQGIVGLPPHDDLLAGQLVNIKWGLTSKGKIYIESKDDYRKRTHASSPDRADGVMYSFVPYMGENLDEVLLRSHDATFDVRNPSAVAAPSDPVEQRYLSELSDKDILTRPM